MKILVISGNYPSNNTPNSGVFVYNLIQQFVKLGNEVTVISVQNILSKSKNTGQIEYGEELATVYRPRFISTSAKKIFSFNSYRIGEFGQIKAIEKVVKENNLEFDVVYAHFITNAFVAVNALAKYNKPIFSAIGESNLDDRKALFKERYFNKKLSLISGFISVSLKLQQKLISYGVEGNKIVFRPNAVDLNKFRKKDKIFMRNRYNLPQNKKLIMFTGRFIHHKGPLRILEATKDIDNLGFIFVGSGEQELLDDRIVFKGKLPSEEVPNLLSCADLFVLPTLKEGSSNAIVEAMACGLPIISSDIPEVQDQCSPKFSILVNPLNLKALNLAIKTIIFNDEKLKEMSNSAVEYSRRFDIKERAKSILEFISSKN